MTFNTTLLTRLLDAPRELVFDCCLKAEHLVHWHSAGGGWTTPYATSDGRTGGRFKIGYAAPDGKVAFDFTGIYTEVTPHSRIVFQIDDGRPCTLDFADQDGKTLVTLTLALEGTHSEEQQRHGWGEILKSLERYTRTLNQKVYAERTITLTRQFAAPRELVWQAWTEPRHIQEWFGPEMFTNPSVTGEAKVGSVMRITMHGPAGSDFDRDFPCTLLYREVVPGQKLVFENDAIGDDGATIIKGLTSVTFADKDGGTEIVMQTTGKAVVEYATGFLQGMEQGWTGSFDKMRRLLEK